MSLENDKMKGVIYILTNPSFPNFVKIGYADDVERRLQELNRSECVPYSFRVYATYKVNKRLSDKSIHAIIDKLNPNLRAIEVVKGKERKREFYAMSAEDAFSILEAIAEIHGCIDRLKRIEPDEVEKNEAKEAEEIEQESKARSNNFTFSEWHIPMGAILHFRDDDSITCKVVDERRVEYEGEKMYLTGLARKLLNTENRGICGPHYFRYKGAKLWDINNRKE
ncbi:MAG: GIY-YIG nuclease family protein [Clostridia bacterium]|nr:GIY-YIG nuclease family protein [Clostridia bacterium]